MPVSENPDSKKKTQVDPVDDFCQLKTVDSDKDRSKQSKKFEES